MSSWDSSQGGGWGSNNGGRDNHSFRSGDGNNNNNNNIMNSNNTNNSNNFGPSPPPMMRGSSSGSGPYPNSVPSSSSFEMRGGRGGGGGGRFRGGGGRNFGGRHGGRHGGRGAFGGRGRSDHRGSFSGPPLPPSSRIGRDREESGDRGPPFDRERDRGDRDRDRFGGGSNDSDYHHHSHASPREMSGDFRSRGSDKFRGGDDGPSFRDGGLLGREHRGSFSGPPPFDQQRGGAGGQYPRGARDYDSRDTGRGGGGPGQHWKDHRRAGSHGTTDSSPGSKPAGPHPPFATAPQMPGDRAGGPPTNRPTDPRRRGSSNDVPSLVGRDGSSSLGSYSSLAEGNTPSSPGRSMGFRSSPKAPGMRRSISEGVVRGYDRTADNFGLSPSLSKKTRLPSDERSQFPPIPPPEFEGPQQRQSSHGLGPKPMDFARSSASSSDVGSLSAPSDLTSRPPRRDPRSQHIEVSTGSAGQDAFGRTREWQQPRQPIRRSSSEGAAPPKPSPRSSPGRSRSILSLSPIKENSTLHAPTLGCTTMSSAAVAAASVAASVFSSVAATSKPSISQGPASPRDRARASSVIRDEKSKVTTTAVPTEEPAKLTISSLGDPATVKRAGTAVLHLQQVVSDKTADVKESDYLPSKDDILSALSKIEKLIQTSQKDLDGFEADAIEEKKKEADLQVKEAQRRAEEDRLRSEKLKRLENEKRMEEKKLKEEAMQMALEECKSRFSEEKKKMQTDFNLRLEQAKENSLVEMNQNMEAELSVDSLKMDKDISRFEHDLEQTKSLVEQVGQKLLSVEKTYHDVLADEEKSQNAPTSGNVSPTSVVSSILEENKRKAAQAHLTAFSLADGISTDSPTNDKFNSEIPLHDRKDPKNNKTFEEWALMAQNVSGPSTALYSEPSETPYFKFNEERHLHMGPLVKEFIRAKKTKLNDHWEMLSEEYEIRKRLYEKQQRKLAKKARGSINTTRKSMILGAKETPTTETTEKDGKPVDPANCPTGRSTNNPYRRSRARGDPVRSDYEQEIIIKEIAEKEAMEKRITHGGSKLPRQICPLEQKLNAVYVNTFNTQRVDPFEEAREEAFTNVWTDMEKCIFLDRFLQFPKDFRRIASFLRNKSTQDCIAFYYDSKQTVPYKGALKEHILRRKRKGEYQVWDASIQSAVSCGAIITAGDDEEKPINFGLPESDMTYRTRMLHPLKREALDCMEIDEMAAQAYAASGKLEETTKWKSRKRGRDPLFSLTKEQTKRLRQSSQEAFMNPTERAKLEEEKEKKEKKEKKDKVETETGSSTPKRQAPQKWTAAEKRVFVETLEEHGRDWEKLSKAVGTKNISQIKNFYYDFKKQLSSGKFRSGMEKSSLKAGNSTPRSSEVASNEEVHSTPRRDKVMQKKKKKKPGVPPTVPKLVSKSLPKKQAIKTAAPAVKAQAQAHSHSASKVAATATLTAEAPTGTSVSNLSTPADSGLLHQDDVPRNEHQILLDYYQQQHAHQQNLASSGLPLSNSAIRNDELTDRLLSSGFAPHDSARSELIQHLLQQQQQQQDHPPSALHHLPPQEAQSSIERYLRGQSSQGEPQHHHHHLGPLLQQQSQQSHHGMLSHLVPSSQLLEGHHHMHAGMHPEGAPSDASNIQRLLQLQQANQRSQLGSLLGLSSTAGTTRTLLAQLETGLAAGPPAPHEPPSGYSTLSNIQGFLGARHHNQPHPSHSHLSGYHHGSSNPTGGHGEAPNVSQSEAFALLQRAMQRDRNNFGQRYE